MPKPPSPSMRRIANRPILPGNGRPGGENALAVAICWLSVPADGAAVVSVGNFSSVSVCASWPGAGTVCWQWGQRSTSSAMVNVLAIGVVVVVARPENNDYYNQE